MANKPDDWEDDNTPGIPDDWEDEDVWASNAGASEAQDVTSPSPEFDAEGFQQIVDPALTEATRHQGPFAEAPEAPKPATPEEPNALLRFAQWVENQARAATAGSLSYGGSNWVDEAAGHLGAQRTMLDAAKLGPSVPMPAYGDAYEARRNEYRRAENQLKEESPYTFHGAGLATGLALGGPTFGGGAAGAAKAGALMGAIGGLGGSEADLVNPTLASAGEAALDTAKGTAFGAAAGAGIQQLGQRGGEFVRWAAEKAKPWLEDTAATRALKAAGYIGKDLKALNKRDMDLALEQGHTLLDEPGLITPGANVSEIRGRLSSLVDDYGERIGRFLEEADETGRQFDIEPFLRRVESEVIGPVVDDPVVRRGVEEIRRIIEGYRQRAQNLGGLSFREANAMKTRMQQHMINWGNAWNESSPGAHADVFAKQTQNLFLNAIDDQLGGILGRGAQADFRDVKRLFGTFKEALQKANERDAAQRGNNAIGLKDYLAGVGALGASLATDSVAPVTAAAGAAALNRVATERGSSAAAVAANRMSQSELLQDLIQSNPQALGEYAAMLANAAARGPGALELQDWMMAQTDPEYAETRRRALETAP